MPSFWSPSLANTTEVPPQRRRCGDTTCGRSAIYADAGGTVARKKIAAFEPRIVG